MALKNKISKNFPFLLLLFTILFPTLTVSAPIEIVATFDPDTNKITYKGITFTPIPPESAFILEPGTGPMPEIPADPVLSSRVVD